MIKKPGRKPYNSKILRYVDPDIVAENGHEIENKDVPKNYVSLQSKINIGPGGTVDKEALDKYIIKARFIKTDYDSVQIGSRMAYVTTDQKFRSGGYVTSKNNSVTTYDAKKDRPVVLKKEVLEREGEKNYILYKGFNNAIFSLQEEDIHYIFVKEKYTTDELKERAKERKKRAKERAQEEASNQVEVVYGDGGEDGEGNGGGGDGGSKRSFGRVSIKRPMILTNFPVYAKNSSGKDEVVYYGRDREAARKFTETSKFARMLEHGWEFENERISDINVELYDGDFVVGGDAVDDDEDNDDDFFDSLSIKNITLLNEHAKSTSPKNSPKKSQISFTMSPQKNGSKSPKKRAPKKSQNRSTFHLSKSPPKRYVDDDIIIMLEEDEDYLLL